jgi:hypothetical protein
VLCVAQSIAVHDADDIWVVELPIEFEIIPAPVHTVYYIWAIVLKTILSLPLLFTAVQQDRADQGLVDHVF